MKASTLVQVLLEDGPEHIQWAAVQFTDGKIFKDLTHYDAYITAAEHYGVGVEDIFATAEEGFTTNIGRFVDREEAYVLAHAAKQHSPAFDKDPKEPWLEYGEVEQDSRYGID